MTWRQQMGDGFDIFNSAHGLNRSPLRRGCTDLICLVKADSMRMAMLPTQFTDYIGEGDAMGAMRGEERRRVLRSN